MIQNLLNFKIMANVETFKCKMSRGDKSIVHLNCVELPGGHVATLEKVGRGKMTEHGALNAYGEGETWEEWERYEDVLFPLFDRVKLEKAGIFEQVKAVKGGATLEYARENGLMDYVARLGTHDGLTLENLTAQESAAFLAAKKVYFREHHCWETGIIWHELVGGRYPADVFNAMRPQLMYHAEQYEEEGNWKGWAVDHHAKMPDVKKALEKIGWTIA